MARVHVLVGAAFCLLAVVIGCKTVDLAAVLSTDGGNASFRVVNGQLVETTLSTHETLKSLGVKDLEIHDYAKTGEYHILGATKAGARFKLIFTRDGAGAAEKTNMHLEWLDGPDAAFGLHLLADVAKKK